MLNYKEKQLKLTITKIIMDNTITWAYVCKTYS